jgi:fructoselysine-6-P-deglycase FrlB-like protein
VAVTNTDGAALRGVADLHIAVLAGAETAGVACRSFQHTLGVLLALGDPVSAADAVLAAADGTEDLLARRDVWLEDATELCIATGATYLIAADARLSSAGQGALMLREGPRLPADACEAGDWLHVDVYLTKPLEYRAILFAGSAYDDSVMEWMRDRDGGVLAVGRDVTGAAQTLRYPGDERDDVALLTEVLVPELIAATAWLRQA